MFYSAKSQLPPLEMGGKYLSPKDIINLRNQKSGGEYTRCLLNEMSNDIPGADNKAVQKVVEKLAEQQGMRVQS